MTTDKPDKTKITDVHIRGWISSQEHFEFKAVDTNLFLTFPERFTTPVFKFRYRMGKNKKREIITLGSYGKISLSNARKLAKQYNGQIANGLSPKIELENRKLAAARESDLFTVEKLTARYFDDRVLPRLKRPENKQWQINRINQALGKMPVEAVTGLHITDMLKADLKRGFPASTNKILETIKQVFAYAAAQHIIAVSPAMYLNKSYAGGEQEARNRNLSQAEIAALFKEMAEAKGFGRENYLAIKLCLLLCVRKSEITQAKKNEFNLEAGTWRLGYDDRKTKNRNAITIPLPRQAVEALRELFTLSESNDYLLPARKAQSRNLPYISEATLNSALKQKIKSLDPFSVHDLRRTGKTKLQELGIDEITSELCLNHKVKGVAGIYGRHDFFEERKKALQLWANYLESCETGQAWNVTPIRKQA
jgi:integrase